jgi:hypothetical protein
VKIGTDIERILSFFLSNLKGCDVDITDGMEL